jgi:hypothetical protein
MQEITNRQPSTVQSRTFPMQLALTNETRRTLTSVMKSTFEQNRALISFMNDHISSSCVSFIRRRVSKFVINESKTAVTDEIGFLCVSLGSSTVQLHNSLGSRRACPCSEAGFSGQNGDRA